MVSIAKEFNDDMQEYLDRLYGKRKTIKEEQAKSAVKPKPVFERPKPKKKVTMEKVPEISEEEIYVEYDEPSGFSAWVSSIFKKRSPQYDDDLAEDDEEELEEMETDIKALDNDIDSLERTREGLVGSFLSKMRSARKRSQDFDEDEYIEPKANVLDQDVKETLKILHKWLEKLPGNELKEFKTSEDFQKYKYILDKYGLIKRKE